MVALNSHNNKLTVKDLRLAAGLKGTQFAKIVGYHKHYMGRFDKKDITTLRVSQLQKVVEAIGAKMTVQIELNSGHFIALGHQNIDFDQFDIGANVENKSTITSKS